MRREIIFRLTAFLAGSFSSSTIVNEVGLKQYKRKNYLLKAYTLHERLAWISEATKDKK